MTLACSMLYVRDLARMRDFYGNILQIRPVSAKWADAWALFEAGGTSFALHAIPGALAAQMDHSHPPAARESSPVKLIFAVDDLPAARARLEAMGVVTLQRSWQDPAESCDCIDPEGNIFQIAARIRLPQLFGRS